MEGDCRLLPPDRVEAVLFILYRRSKLEVSEAPPIKYQNFIVFLPTFRQPEVLIQTLRDFCHQSYPSDSWQLILLDNRSSDGSDFVGVKTPLTDITFFLKRLPPDDETYSHASLFNELVRLTRPKTDVIVHGKDLRVQKGFHQYHVKWNQIDETTLAAEPICEGPIETFEREGCGRWELMEPSDVDAEAYECDFRSVWAKTLSYSVNLVGRLSKRGSGDPSDSEISD